MKEISKEKRAAVISKAVEIGILEEKAGIILDTFLRAGGLTCLFSWPEEFSLMTGRRNFMDILLEEGLVLK